MSIPDQSHLSTQFQRLLEGAAEMGVELPENMPGMARIGGLHVPVASTHMQMARTGKAPEEHFQQYDMLGLSVPDEQGNMHTLEVHPFDTGRQMSQTGFWSGTGWRTPKSNGSASAAEFAEKYGSLGTPDDSTRQTNLKKIDRLTFTDRLMGVVPGTVRGITATGASVQEGIHSVFDPRTGQSVDAAMDSVTAHSLWMKDWYRRQEEQDRRQGL